MDTVYLMDTSFHFQAHSTSKTEYDQPMQFIDKPVNTNPIEQNIMLYDLRIQIT